MKYFKIKLKHDKGTLTVKINSSDEQAARQTIMDIERCPPGAILSVKEIGPYRI